jgi:integrase
MKKKLVAAALETLPEGEYWDALQPTLILRVGKNRKTWQCKFRASGKNHRVRLGYHPELGLAAARSAAAELGKRVDGGQRAVAAPPVLHPRSPDILTVEGVIARYEKMRRKEGVRIKSLDDALKVVRANLGDCLNLPAKAFSKADLRARRDVVFERAPSMSAAFLRYLGPIWRWAAMEDLVEVNFVPALRKAAVTKRDRVLTSAEVKAIWQATFKLDTGDAARSYARLVRFLTLCAQRLDEGASVTHGDIIDGCWKFRTKGGKPHRLKLPALALDQVGHGEASALAFPGKRGKISGWSKLKHSLDKASGVSDWRLHDLRRTAASRMEELGIDAALVHHVLNHSRQGLSKVYLHGDLFDRMGDALATWSAELERIVGARRAIS